MNIKEDLRLFLEKEVRDYTDYNLVGGYIKDYFSNIFIIFLAVIKEIQGDIINYGHMNYNKNRELRQILLDKILDVNNPSDYQQVKVSLDRLRLKYDETKIQEDFLTKVHDLMQKTKPIVAIITLITIILKVFLFIVKTRDKLKKEADTNKVIQNTIDFIYESLEKVLNDIFTLKIKDEKMLKRRFYLEIDRVSNYNAKLSPYLKSWGSEL